MMQFVRAGSAVCSLLEHHAGYVAWQWARNTSTMTSDCTSQLCQRTDALLNSVQTKTADYYPADCSSCQHGSICGHSLGMTPVRAASLESIRRFSTSSFAAFSVSQSKDSKEAKHSWKALVSQMPDKINPCNSPLHPAVVEGLLKAQGDEVCVQEAYTPHSTCFGCGPEAPEGLHLKSFRIRNGLEAQVVIPGKFCAFPGIVNGGIVSALLDCHGNWTAAIALMDKGCLPRPPLTLTHSMYVTFKEPTPPEVLLLVRSQVLSIKESSQPGLGKPSVEVETSVYLREGSDASTELVNSTTSAGPATGAPKGLRLLVSAVCLHKRLGALRAL